MTFLFWVIMVPVILGFVGLAIVAVIAGWLK
jgi:hypothetical protein